MFTNVLKRVSEKIFSRRPMGVCSLYKKFLRSGTVLVVANSGVPSSCSLPMNFSEFLK